ncbi:hypothetical protein OSB04_001392 [Centaurea solstitialis]|uniref:RRM domain-containing protein n=1 Tax=Centaurea solstitialis TaxID=347529 RepID=A0AA38U3I1_9ASTR|nr:hypothetical protein OSB04_001392 [Centaurea solstitialis]
MSDEGEKTCPLCAEEMDLTDQQLKPCRCGYDNSVARFVFGAGTTLWIWLRRMIQKGGAQHVVPLITREKIVGTASKCERFGSVRMLHWELLYSIYHNGHLGLFYCAIRLMAEMNVEKKQKSQKGKTKPSDGRKQLTSVRVIQRNLVYIVGLPLNLADEDVLQVLQRKEYFGQYGKVLKVSISRTAAGAIQHFANNTCSVYITYSKEDEAVRSIQSVHGFVLEGRPLRACFGTTKYCHAWLRNMPCTNPDCLYLHEFGSQEDSFTKDEIISEYTRGRVQQVTGATNDMQRRSGSMLPPPADDYSNNSTPSWAKPISKSTTNDTAISMKGSPPNSSSGRSVALPAAASWGTRASNSQSLSASSISSNGPSKQKVDTSTTLSFSTGMVSPSSHSNEMLNKHSVESPTADGSDELEHPEYAKQVVGSDHRKMVSDIPATTGLLSVSTINSHHLYTASRDDKNESISIVPNLSRSSETYRQSADPAPDKDLDVSDEGSIYTLSSDISSLSITRNQGLQPCDTERLPEPPALNKAKKAASPTMNICVTREQPCSMPDFRNKVQEVAISEAEADLLSFNDQRLSDPEVVTQTGYVQNMPQSSHLNNSSMGYSPQQRYLSVNGSLDPPFVNQNLEKGSLPNTFNMPIVNGHLSNLDGDERPNGHSYFPATEGSRKQSGVFENTAVKGDHNTTALDLGENSIISNILSMDFDPWDESLTSPQNLAKLLGDGDKQQGSHRVSASRKTQNCNQSRFSFAREDECVDQGSHIAPTLSDFAHGLNHQNTSRDFYSNTDAYQRQISDANGFSSFNFEESDRTSSNHTYMPSNKVSVSRSQISAPPGFLGPSRAPPPGFTSNERIEQTYDNLSGNHMYETSPLMRKVHQAPAPVYNGGVGDLEFMDPAIMAVGGRVPSGLSSPGLDMRSNYPSQHTSFENDNRLRLLVQRSFSPQNQRFSELGGDNFAQRTDGYGVPSRSPYQQQGNFQQPRSSLMSNVHWDGWNEVQQSGNDIAMAELLRNERLGFNKYYSGYEDAKFRLPSSGDLYNRTFGI